MGTTKALVDVHGQTMVDRTLRTLSEVCSETLEVGPGYSGARFVVENPPGGGALAATVAGWKALGSPGLVLAVDMPLSHRHCS